MKITLASLFGRRARRIGFLGLGASSLLAPARVMGGVMLAAAGIWAVVDLHQGSGSAKNSVHRAKPAFSKPAPHRTHKQFGVAELDAIDVNLVMAANLNPSGHGKSGSQKSGQAASGFQAAGFGSFAGGGSWPRGFGHRPSGVPASNSNSSPAASSKPPGSLPSQKLTLPGPGPSAPPLDAPWHPGKPGPSPLTDAVAQLPPGPAFEDPITQTSTTPYGTSAASDPGGPAEGPGLVVDPSGPPVHLGLVIEPGGPPFDLGLVVDPGGPAGDPVGLPGDLNPGSGPSTLVPLPETVSPQFILASGLPFEPVAGPAAFGASALVSIPEPSSTGLLGIGLLGLWATRRFRAATRPRM